ncbi:MAG: PcfJ domain-containing protein [Spirochaetia bacterium]|nr:PcfJ domain-containing protein [Spirochaetia bacterium]
MTKEKQFIYLTDEAKNKKYSLNINLKEIKNEKTGRILKNFPNINIEDLEDNSSRQNRWIIETIKRCTNNINTMFLLLEFQDKINSIYTPLKINIDTYYLFEKISYCLEIIKTIGTNFLEFTEILKSDNYPEDISSSIVKYPCYLLWKNYKDLISFENFYIFCNSIYSFYNENIEFGIFILKTLKKGKFLPLADKPNYSFLRSYCDMLKDYLNQCVFLNKTPHCENNMLREINETAESYSFLKEEFDKEKFKTNYKKHQKAWNFNYSDFIVTIPIEPKDLVIEGQKMHHCVGSYVDKVSNNETYIVFIRRKDNIEMPYITAQVDLNGTLRQYYLAYDKEIVNEEDIEFKEKYQEHLSKVWDLG